MTQSPTVDPLDATETPSDLARLADLATEAGLPALARQASREIERLAEGRFYVACVGQFKRGKSTLINALVGQAVLPAGVAPVTSVVTVVRYGPQLHARVRLANQAWQPIAPDALAAYVSEEWNPDNTKQVEAVEVFLPASLLEGGLCLVDTPGVGSVFAGATRATHDFVPHIDAALVVLGADPPIANEEQALILEVAAHVDTLIFVLGKADRFSDADREEAARFSKPVLSERLGRPVETLLHVSALEHLAGTGPERDWPRLFASLAALGREAGAGLVQSGETRAVKDLSSQLLRALDERLSALQRPLEETQRRLDSLRDAAADLNRALGDLYHLLTAEQERIVRDLRADRESFLARSLQGALHELTEGLTGSGSYGNRRLRQDAITLAQQIARRHLDRWLNEERATTETRYRAAARRFVDLANTFLARFEAARELVIDRLPSPFDPEARLRAPSRVFYTEHLALTASSWKSWLLRPFLSGRALHRAVLRDARAYLAGLLTSNSARIQNDLIERVRESRRRLEAEIRERLSTALVVAEEAFARARMRHAAGAAAVRAEIETLATLRRAVENLAVPK
jgi:GTPase SAR1 family protein